MTTVAVLTKELTHERQRRQQAERRAEELGKTAQMLLPKPTALQAGGSTTQVTTTAEARVGRLYFERPIWAQRFSYRHGGSGSANAILRFALYSESGQQRLFNLTDAVGAGASGIRTMSVGARLFLPAGFYWILACLSSGTTAPAVWTWNTDASMTAPDANTPDLEGTLAVTAGAAPTTLDPTGLTASVDSTPMCRLDAKE